MKVEVDNLQIATVNGEKVRIVPLVVRGPDRRKANVSLAPGCKVKVTLPGEIGPDGSVVLSDRPPAPHGDAISVTYLGRSVMTVEKKRVSMVERRSGVDRRKA